MFPISRLDDQAIPSGHPSVNCSIHPDDVPYRPDARQPSIIRPDDVFFPSGPSTVSRSFCASLHTSGRLSSPSGRPSVIDQLQILSKFRIREDRYIRPNDVVSRPDAGLHKAKIAIQISLSGRQSALFRTRVQLIWKLLIRLQPSRRLLFMVRTRVYLIWKLRVKVQPSGRSSPMVRMHEALYGNYLQRTYDRPDVSVSLFGCGSQTRKIFSGISEKTVVQLSVRTAKVHRQDGVRTYHCSLPFCSSVYK
jgi:hypothetical protein